MFWLDCIEAADNFFYFYFLSNNFFFFKLYGEDRSIYLCKQKTKKKLSLNTRATPMGHAAKHQ